MRALLVLLILVGCAGKTVVTKPTESEMPKAYPAPAPPPPPKPAPTAPYYPFIPREQDVVAADEEVELRKEIRKIPRARPTETVPIVSIVCPTLAPSITYNCASPPCPGPPPPKPPGPWWEDQMKVILAAISGGIGMIVTALASRVAGLVKKPKPSEI